MDEVNNKTKKGFDTVHLTISAIPISPSTFGTSYANEGMYMAFHNSYHPFIVSFSVTYRFGKNIDIKKHSSVSREVETRF